MRLTGRIHTLTRYEAVGIKISTESQAVMDAVLPSVAIAMNLSRDRW